MYMTILRVNRWLLNEVLCWGGTKAFMGKSKPTYGQNSPQNHE